MKRNQSDERNFLSTQKIIKKYGFSKISKEKLKEILNQYSYKDKNTILFITRKLLKHGYNENISYEKTQYDKATEKTTFTCKIHGDFEQTPSNHMNSDYGCEKCSRGGDKYGKKNWEYYFNIIKKRKDFNEYDYSKVVFKGSCKKITIIHKPCNTEFNQNVKCHVDGQGCPVCGKNKMSEHTKKSLKFYKEKASKIHSGKYDYSLIEKNSFVNSHQKVPIKCKKHGIFYQSFHHHCQGHGCPICSMSNMETLFMSKLNELGINFEFQKPLRDFGYKGIGQYQFDFYLNDRNAAIELDGGQHFFTSRFGNETEEEMIERLNAQKERDKFKNDFCKENAIKLIRVPYFRFTEFLNNFH